MQVKVLLLRQGCMAGNVCTYVVHFVIVSMDNSRTRKRTSTNRVKHGQGASL